METVYASDMHSAFPKYIEIQTTSLCNANCTVCPYEAAEQKFGISRMSDTLLSDIISEIAEHRTSVYRVIPYLNNEPSLDPRLLEILRRLKKENLSVELSTNFSGFTPSKMEAIAAEDLVEDLRISFFGGSRESYQSIMKDLDFEKVTRKLNYFLSIPGNAVLPKTVLILVLLPLMNIREEKQQLAALFPSLPIRFFGYLDRAGNNAGFKNDLVLKPAGSSYRLDGCSLKRPDERCCILANGDVIICSQDWNREVIIGNVGRQGIAALWNSSEMAAIRNKVFGKSTVDEDFICRRCKLAYLKDPLTGQTQLNFKGDKYMNAEDGKRMDEIN